MANIKSAIKRVQIAERNRLRNKAYKSTVKTLIKKCLVAVQAGDTAQVETVIRSAYSKIDKAVKRGVIHPNNGARKKSRLARQFKQLTNQQLANQQLANQQLANQQSESIPTTLAPSA